MPKKSAARTAGTSAGVRGVPGGVLEAVPLSFARVFGKKEFQKTSFRSYVPCVSRYVRFLPPKQERDTRRNFGMKRLFRDAFSERSKRSEKERDERNLHGVPGSCS